MKKQLIAFVGMMMLSLAIAQAQNVEEALKTTVSNFEKTQDVNEQIAYSNRLELIANRYSDQWTAAYYAAYSKAMLGIREQDNTKKDQYLDAADKYLEKAKALSPENDEIYVLSALIATNRIGVDPQNRWQKYGQLFSSNIEKAKSIRKNNPRIYYIQGINLLFTPEQFGGGKKVALPFLEKAEALFQQEKEDNMLNPFWGKGSNTHFLAECRKQ